MLSVTSYILLVDMAVTVILGKTCLECQGDFHIIPGNLFLLSGLLFTAIQPLDPPRLRCLGKPEVFREPGGLVFYGSLDCAYQSRL